MTTRKQQHGFEQRLSKPLNQLHPLPRPFGSMAQSPQCQLTKWRVCWTEQGRRAPSRSKWWAWHHAGDDVARVGAVRDALGPGGRIRIDANGAWTLDEAEHAIREMEMLDLDYVEQPVTGLSDMAELRRRISRLGIQVAADESIRRFGDIDAVIASEACDVVIVKVQPLGGLSATRQVAHQALDAGLEVVVSSALESSVGLYRGAQMVGWLQDTFGTVLDAGLGTQGFLSADVVSEPLVARRW